MEVEGGRDEGEEAAVIGGKPLTSRALCLVLLLILLMLLLLLLLQQLLSSRRRREGLDGTEGGSW